MPERPADVVVVGAGIVGASIAYQLVRRGAGRVVVLDKGIGVAEGSTGASSSIVRTRYTHPELVRLAWGGQRAYRNWAEFTGLTEPRSEFHPVGVLWMMGEEREVVLRDRDRLIAADVVATALDSAAVRERFPALSTCGARFDLTGEEPHTCVEHDAFLFEEEGGFADPVGANQDLLEAARREGAAVRYRSQVVAVRRDGGRVRGVDLADGSRIDAPVVVNAAGPWCGRLNDLAGIELKWSLRPTRVQVLYREWPPEVPGPLPVVGDASSGIYLRPEARGQQILFGSILPEDEQETVADPDDYNRNADAAFRDVKIHGLHHRIPGLPHRGAVTGIAGLYTVNVEDVHPVVGPTALEGFVVANGFSGHGFKLAPMIGALVARWVTGEAADFDTDVPIEFLAVDRQPLLVPVKNVLA